jgi:anti-anti-sigma regulatory factor
LVDRDPSRPGSVVVAVGSPIAPAELPALCAAVRSRIERSGAGAVVIDLGAVVAPDVVTIDAMARLALVARRMGCRVHLRDVPVELRELLAFTGLDAALADPDAAGLALELQGQAELREDPLDVEEEAELDDPSV